MTYSNSNYGYFAGILRKQHFHGIHRTEDRLVQKKALLPHSFFPVVASVRLKKTRVVKTKKSAQPKCRGLSTLIFACSAQFVFQDAKFIHSNMDVAGAMKTDSCLRSLRLRHHENEWSELCGRVRFEICISFFLSIAISY